DERGPVVIARDRLPDDLGVALLWGIGYSELLVDVARPLEGAHTHHLPLRLHVIAAAALPREGLAHPVPDLLARDDDAVKIEHHSLDHAGVSPESRPLDPPRRRRGFVGEPWVPPRWNTTALTRRASGRSSRSGRAAVRTRRPRPRAPRRRTACDPRQGAPP